MRKSKARPGDGRNGERSLIAAGEVFHDLIFYDLQRLPAMGEELKTDTFTVSVGGGAAITGAAAAGLGRKCRLLTVWGDSPLDVEARTRLLQLGLEVDLSALRRRERAGLTVAVSTREDRYFLTCPGANRFVEARLLESDAFAAAQAGDHVHLALAPKRWQPFQQLVNRLKERSVTSSWDLGWDPEAASQPAFAQLRRALDVLFLNEMEALRYTGAEDAETALDALCKQGDTVVVKLGSKGAIAGRGEQRAESAPLSVEAMETTGAGDAFNGGFLHRWMEGDSLEDCLRAGNICGGLSTRRPGGLDGLPTAREFASKFD
ncbi:MAG TPA: carbohydrate kinase family protein [Acidobacteriota bacterium]|nr:carbohydrate kinase family protein [Acidobacteriota bacterium]